MQKQFHITLRGNPEECRAQISCRLGGSHYESKAEAMEAYEAENAHSSIPLAVQRDDYRAMSSIIRHRTVDNLQEMLRTATVRPDADPKTAELVSKWVREGSFLEGIEGLPRPKTAIYESVTNGQAMEQRDHYLLEQVTEVYDLNPEQEMHYWNFAQAVAVGKLSTAEFEKSRIQRTPLDRRTEKETARVYQDYNQALLRANRIAKEYDRSLKANGKAGYPKTWKQANAEATRKLERSSIIPGQPSWSESNTASYASGQSDVPGARIVLPGDRARGLSRLMASIRKMF